MFKKYRVLNHLTQEQLAELIDADPRTIQRIENGECEPSLKTLKKLIVILKIPDKDIINFLKDSTHELVHI